METVTPQSVTSEAQRGSEVAPSHADRGPLSVRVLLPDHQQVAPMFPYFTEASRTRGQAGRASSRDKMLS